MGTSEDFPGPKLNLSVTNDCSINWVYFVMMAAYNFPLNVFSSVNRFDFVSQNKPWQSISCPGWAAQPCRSLGCRSGPSPSGRLGTGPSSSSSTLSCKIHWDPHCDPRQQLSVAVSQMSFCSLRSTVTSGSFLTQGSWLLAQLSSELGRSSWPGEHTAPPSTAHLFPKGMSVTTMSTEPVRRGSLQMSHWMTSRGAPRAALLQEQKHTRALRRVLHSGGLQCWQQNKQKNKNHTLKHINAK